MDIAFVTTGYYPDQRGGAAISSNLIVEALREQGISVDVFTQTGKTNRRVRVGSDRYEIPSGTGYPIVPERVGKNLGALLQLPTLDQYDVVHVYGPAALPGAVLRSDPPVVGTVNGVDWVYINPMEYLRDGCPRYTMRDAIRYARLAGYQGPMLLAKLSLEFLGKSIAKRADAITVQNAGMRNILTNCSYDRRKISIVPNILDSRFETEIGVPSNSDEISTLIFIGRLIERKGALDLVEAFLDLPNEINEEWELKIYGYGPLENEIERKIADNNADNIMLDYCDYEDLPEVYRNASAMVHATKYPEPFSRTWLEAMASGTPIICSTNPSSEAVLNGVAELYDPYDKADLKRALLSVLPDYDRRVEMVQKGREQVDQYRANSIASQYIDVYQSLTSSPR